jgi:hypothetical protein
MQDKANAFRLFLSQISVKHLFTVKGVHVLNSENDYLWSDIDGSVVSNSSIFGRALFVRSNSINMNFRGHSFTGPQSITLSHFRNLRPVIQISTMIER